jgi:hypothetical protein
VADKLEEAVMSYDEDKSRLELSNERLRRQGEQERRDH